MKTQNITLLDDLKHLYGLNTNVEVANQFNIPIKTIETWVFKNHIPERGLSLQYISLLIENAKRDLKLKKKIEDLLGNF